jgi:hypothetical protein
MKKAVCPPSRQRLTTAQQRSCLFSSMAEQAALNREVASSNLARGTRVLSDAEAVTSARG